MKKTAIAFAAAFVLGSASAALAQATGEEFQNSPYQLNPTAPVPLYSEQAPHALIEGRNVGIVRSDPAARNAPVSQSQAEKNWFNQVMQGASTGGKY